MDQEKTRRTSGLWLGIVAAGVAVAGAILWSLMQQSHRDVGAEEAQFKMVPQELVTVMAKGDSTSNVYLNAAVELFGVMAENDAVRLVFEGGVVAAWDTTRERRALEVGELIRVKGRVTGYDDLFDEVRMDGAVLLEGAP